MGFLAMDSILLDNVPVNRQGVPQRLFSNAEVVGIMAELHGNSMKLTLIGGSLCGFCRTG